MKKQSLFTLIICAFSSLAFSQSIELGTYRGTGKMKGLSCPVSFRFETSGVVGAYAGICNCVSILKETDTRMLFQEKDFLSVDGSTPNDACRSRAFVFFSKKKQEITANWGETPDEALANKSPTILLKTK